LGRESDTSFDGLSVGRNNTPHGEKQYHHIKGVAILPAGRSNAPREEQYTPWGETILPMGRSKYSKWSYNSSISAYDLTG